MKKTTNLQNARKNWRDNPENQKRVKEAIAKGYWNKDDDPTGDINAVDKMMFDKNEKSRKKELEAIMKTKSATPSKEKGLAETMAQ